MVKDFDLVSGSLDTYYESEVVPAPAICKYTFRDEFCYPEYLWPTSDSIRI